MVASEWNSPGACASSQDEDSEQVPVLVLGILLVGH